MAKRPLAERNALICEMRRKGCRVKTIARAAGVKDHVVSKVLRDAGMTSPHEAQLGPKKSLQEGMMERGPCLCCRGMFRGHRWQFRCDPCLKAAAGLCVL